MTTTDQKIRQEIEALVKQGKDILTYKFGLEVAKELVKEGKQDKKIVELAKATDLTPAMYQKWYTQSLPIIQQLLPERYLEFKELHRLEKRKEINESTYTISDYLNGYVLTRSGQKGSTQIFLSKLKSQKDILESALTRLDSILVNIKAVLQSGLFDDELSVAKELLNKSHLRAAGAVAGVVIERHFAQVATAHQITIRKKDPTIADFNDSLKNAGILDVPKWRFIQRLADIRNLCVHSKDREPAKEEVEDLISGAEKVIKTIF